MTDGVTVQYHASITVSGYPAMPAMSVFFQGQAVGTVTSIALEEFLGRETMGPPSATHMWCAACRTLVPAIAVQDGRLGYRGYCDACVRRLVTVCKRKHRRLPTSGEFYCPGGCGQILPLEEMCPVERDGRQRRKCRGCRLDQLRELRRIRRANGAAS